SQFSKPSYLFLAQLSLIIHVCLGARKLTSLYRPPPMALTYHGGALLEGDLPVSILWYGNFAPPQKSIVVDFLLSLNHIDPQKDQQSKSSVSLWWGTVQTYMKKANPHFSLNPTLRQKLLNWQKLEEISCLRVGSPGQLVARWVDSCPHIA
ncbi:unnamed protein product, partial [Prunus brigantina]